MFDDLLNGPVGWVLVVVAVAGIPAFVIIPAIMAHRFLAMTGLNTPDDPDNMVDRVTTSLRQMRAMTAVIVPATIIAFIVLVLGSLLLPAAVVAIIMFLIALFGVPVLGYEPYRRYFRLLHLVPSELSPHPDQSHPMS